MTINNNLPRRLQPQRSTPPPPTPTSPFFTGPPPLPLHTLFSLLPDIQRNEKGEVAKRAFFQPVAPRAVLFHNFPEHLYSSRQLLINPSSAQNSKLKHLNEVINQINPIEVHIRLLAPSPPHFQLALSNSPSPHFQLAPFHLRFCIILCDIFTNWFFSLVLYVGLFSLWFSSESLN